MPVRRSKDSKGSYYQFGHHGKKYYYVSGSKRSRTIAINKAKRQGRAEHARKRY